MEGQAGVVFSTKACHGRLAKIFRYGPLAQLAEHLTFNQGVTGSRPVRPTKAGRPSLSGGFETNQGVNSLGQPTP